MGLGFHFPFSQLPLSEHPDLTRQLLDLGYEHVWTGKYAKWFEECARSQAGNSSSADPQVTGTFWDKQFFESRKDVIFLGTLDPTSVTFCYDMPLVSSPMDESLVQGNAESKFYN